MTESFLIRALSASSYYVEDMSIQVVSIYILLVDALLLKYDTIDFHQLEEPLMSYLDRFKRVYDNKVNTQSGGSGYGSYGSGGYGYGTTGYGSYGYNGYGYSNYGSNYDDMVTMSERELRVSYSISMSLSIYI